jgi:predicted ATP-grasp superfamily ATP-dependent carboligase
MFGWAPDTPRTGSITILVHEWVTGGGLAGNALPASWAAEGAAMRRAIAADFSAVPSVRVVVTLDTRFTEDHGPWSIVPVGPDEEEATLRRLASTADYTVLIAPETGGILADRSRTVAGAGGRGLGSSPEAVAMTSDKLRLGCHLSRCNIATPPCREVTPRLGLPIDSPYPAVLKPIDGAGSQNTYLVRAVDAWPEEALSMPAAVLQPLMPGVAHSASFLVGPEGRAWLVAAGRQHIAIRDGRFLYRGGTVPVVPHGVVEGPRRAVESVPGLCGFVGVDYLWDERTRRATVLEINPRPTTSYVGLARWLPPGTLAQAWLEVVSGKGTAEENDPPFWDADPRKTVTFAADGGMMKPDEELSHEGHA